LYYLYGILVRNRMGMGQEIKTRLDNRRVVVPPRGCFIYG
jgi:hypothetical protein